MFLVIGTKFFHVLSQLKVALTARSVGPPGFINIAIRWLNTVLNVMMTPIAVQVIPKMAPSLLRKTGATTVRNVTEWFHSR
jgi:arginine exporter protein ArgO